MNKNVLQIRHIQRIIILLFFLCACLLAIVIHLGYIQVVSSDRYQGVDLVTNSIEQRSRNVLLDIGRGDILTRDFVSITGREKLAILLLPRSNEIIDKEKDKIIEIAQILGVNEKQILDIMTSITYPQILEVNQQVVEVDNVQAAKVVDVDLSGTVLIQVKERYTAGMIARHVVGFIGEDPALISRNYNDYLRAGIYQQTDLVGKTGLEYSYELELKSEGATYLSYYIYQDRNLLLHPFYGLGMKIQESQNKHRPVNIITTLDYDLQTYSESLLDSYRVAKGAIVILDINTGDIVAMASRPDFNPKQMTMSEYENTRNRAIASNFPGSVFKAVIALGALEEGITTIHDQYTCNGSFTFSNGQRLRCWTDHGTLSLSNAFAESCNATFAYLATQLGRDNIIKYSEALGLGDVVGYYDDFLGQPQLYLEDRGSIFLVEGSNQQLVANTGIGQQDVRISPLQAANMMATIVNYGTQTSPRIVSELQSKSGHSLHKYLPITTTNGISRHTYYEMQKLLAAVVQHGTASQLGEAGIFAAGKTGTAEIGNTGKVNRWFTGYFPDKYPRYSIAVVIEDVSSREQIGTTINIFKDIVTFTLSE